MDKTIKEVYPDYLAFLKLKYKITTLRNIDYKVKNYILPYFGNMNINAITEQDYINFQLKIKTLNYSQSFNEQIQSIAKNYFNYLAVMYKIENIPQKVGNLLCYGKKQSSTKPSTWTKKEYKRFIKKVDHKIYHAFFNVLFYTGLRKSEAMALKITDFNGKSLYVTKSITKDCYNGKRQLLSTKSGKSREIKLDFLLRIELKHLIKYYTKHLDNFNSDSFLFGGDKPISPTTLERKKNYYCQLAGVRRIRIHDFRHSHATILYQKKVDPKLIQSRLGHANISTTLNTYVHTNEKQQKRLINTINLIRL